MTFDEMKAIVAGSSVDDWNIIPPPTFLDSHYSRAAYKPDLSLGIAFGLDYMHGMELDFSWSERFDDSTVTGEWADIFWNGMLVHRELVLRVDGSRAILPPARGEYAPSASGSPLDAELFAETVSRWKCDFARLVHDLAQMPRDFDSYLQRAGFVIVPDDDDDQGSI